MTALAATAGRHARGLRRVATAAALLALVLAGAIALLPGSRGAPRAGAEPGGEVTPQTDASVPTGNVTFIGGTPREAGTSAGDAVWGVGEENGNATIVRYSGESGWTLGPGLQDTHGQPLSGFTLDQPGTPEPSAIAGQMAPDGAGAMVGTLPGSGSEGEGGRKQVVLVRDPGGAFSETPLPQEGEGAPQPGESLFGAARAPMFAPLEETSGKAGLLLVPVKTSGTEQSVLHWNGSSWSREPIEVPAASNGDFRVLAIAADAPGDAWLLAQLSSSAYPAGSVALFRRHGSGAPGSAWRPVALVPGAGDGEAHPLTLDGEPFTVPGTGEPPTVKTQVLTVTGQGVWVDGRRSDVNASATLFFKPEGEDGGQVLAGWCSIPASAPAGTHCDHELPEALPTGAMRSFAWQGSGEFGERVITGFADGVSLRLEGSEFTRVLALGGSEAPRDVGGSFGAAFDSPREGWLGEERLPVHLTLHPAANRLQTWPVPFSRALLAIAPQPGAPVGALSSEALAVGDRGEVARYIPGSGWLPESLLSSGGRLQTPRLRAVAWPTPNRAYAVGDLGQMWLWRGETGLWEPDPAVPINFRGNLLGIAFDPNDPSRGYAVGQGGVLLSYGKSWTQEEALPEQAAGADFTSVAFAGSEAIVAFRRPRNPTQAGAATGGVMVNEGAGWRVDGEAQAALGSHVPSVVAGLADGGAAIAAEATGAGQTLVLERQSPGAPWQSTPGPLPAGVKPGSLALFRDGGSLRAIASGALGGAEIPLPSPPGFPPPLIKPYGLGANNERGVLRQTGNGWSDEEHELNDVREPPGNYPHYDTVYEPDPIAAVLVDPGGGQGWAVGGYVEAGSGSGAFDTAEVARYPAEGGTPPGEGTSTVPLEPTVATFAVGGGAACAAPCADRGRARIGPRVWLASALGRSREIGARAFLYTGPGITEGLSATGGPSSVPLRYGDELAGYASTLAAGGPETYAAISPNELAGRPFFTGNESVFNEAFAGFASPFGGGALAPGSEEPSHPSAPCASSSPGCQTDYYAFTSDGANGVRVRVIVLDTSGEVDPAQRQWLSEELARAAGGAIPAIVIGNADLNARIAAGDGAAAAVAQTLNEGNASAYFYDSPEKNIELPLDGGSIPTFGSGTLGYVNDTAQASGEFLGASGFLLAQVGALGPNRRASVTARLIPAIGELALEAQDGTLLRRSQAALFAALARRPRAGSISRNDAAESESTPYIPIGIPCNGGAICANALLPEFEFSSSRPEIGDFVKRNLAAAEAHAVELGANGMPIHDPHSPLFCAYNAGTTTVTISAGGLSSSLPVTVQAGSVRRPCGTVALKALAAVSQQPAALTPPAPPPVPASAPPASGTPSSLALPAPSSPALAPAPAPPPPVRAPPPPPNFFVPAALPVALVAAVPPPVPTPARPTPPTGTSAVTSPVEAAEREEEEEEAPESVSNKAAAYRAHEDEPSAAFILGIVLLAAFAGATVRRRPRRGRRELRVAPATVNAARAQRRWRAQERTRERERRRGVH